MLLANAKQPRGFYLQAAAFESYKAQYAAIKAIDPLHPVFVLDCAWFQAPALEWWTAWNSFGSFAWAAEITLGGSRARGTRAATPTHA